jgi:hypothetical protein
MNLLPSDVECSHPEGCPRAVKCRYAGCPLCPMHYRRALLYGGNIGPAEPVRRPKRDAAFCAHPDGCPRSVHGGYRGIPLCNRHLEQIRQLGCFGPVGAVHPLPDRCEHPDGCQLPVRKLRRFGGVAYCDIHYARAARNGGDPGPVGRLRAPWGSGYINRGGYRMLSVNGRQVAEHRLVMEKLLGRPLRHDEQIDHGLGGKADNRPENLGLRRTNNHVGHSIEELVAFSREMLRLYGEVDPSVYTIAPELRPPTGAGAESEGNRGRAVARSAVERVRDNPGGSDGRSRQHGDRG